MRRPNPMAAARLSRARIEGLPDPVEPDPFMPAPLVEPDLVSPALVKQVDAFIDAGPVTRRPCGHCLHGQDGHGSRYAALVGWHEWVPEAPSARWMRTGRSS